MSNYGNIKISYVDGKSIVGLCDPSLNIIKEWSAGSEIHDNILCFFHVRLSQSALSAINESAKYSDFLKMTICEKGTGYKYIENYVSKNGKWFKICNQINEDLSVKQIGKIKSISIRETINNFLHDQS